VRYRGKVPLGMIVAMAEQARATNGDGGACWQCGAPAQADCAYALKLVAGESRQLDAQGYPVIRGRRRDQLRVAVPRCIACRNRSRDSIVILFASMVAGAILVPVVQSLFWPGLASWLHVGHEGPLGTASAIGLVAGAVAAITGVAWQRRRLGLRALNAYPPVLALKRAGWHEPSS
jgi:hypothetical protein